MAYLAQRYNTRRAGDEDEAGNGKLTGVWSVQPPFVCAAILQPHTDAWADTHLAYFTCHFIITSMSGFHFDRIPIEDAPTLIKEYELTKFAAELVCSVVYLVPLLRLSRSQREESELTQPSYHSLCLSSARIRSPDHHACRRDYQYANSAYATTTSIQVASSAYLGTQQEITRPVPSCIECCICFD